MDKRKITPTLETENLFWRQGLPYVAGLDEAGRGAWAGPVYAAAVILPQAPEAQANLKGVRDSKLLSARQRTQFSKKIIATALAVGIGKAEAEEIDELGIVPATRLAMQRALAALPIAPQALIIDALRLPSVLLPQQAFPYADARSLSVAAAGIMAKVSRDCWMIDIAEAQYPHYGFAQHKGYGTAQHREALQSIGPCLLHRYSFRPVAECRAPGPPLSGQESAHEKHPGKQLPLIPEPVNIVPYDPDWPHQYEAERARIAHALGELALEIHHIGSTAVPGLHAKPIIDIAVALKSLEQAESCIPSLHALGYTFVDHPENIDRRFFRKGHPRTHHLHLMEAGTATLTKHLDFRDALRTNEIQRERYAQLKITLAAQHENNREAYTNAKTTLVEEILAHWREENAQQ